MIPAVDPQARRRNRRGYRIKGSRVLPHARLSGSRFPHDVRPVCPQPAVDRAADDAADDRRHPEQPQLAQCTGTREQGHAGRTGGVDRGIGHRNADQVDQRERQTDGDRRETDRRAAVGGAWNTRTACRPASTLPIRSPCTKCATARSPGCGSRRRAEPSRCALSRRAGADWRHSRGVASASQRNACTGSVTPITISPARMQRRNGTVPGRPRKSSGARVIFSADGEKSSAAREKSSARRAGERRTPSKKLGRPGYLPGLRRKKLDVPGR